MGVMTGKIFASAVFFLSGAVFVSLGVWLLLTRGRRNRDFPIDPILVKLQYRKVLFHRALAMLFVTAGLLSIGLGVCRILYY